MHMLYVIAGGAVLLGVFLLYGKLWGGVRYTVREELPILLSVFPVPAALACLVIWKQG